MATLRWTETALADLDSIADYIALDNEEAASRLVQRVVRHVEMLETHPKLGSTVPELRPDRRYRQIVEYPCRIFYRHEEETGTVFVLGVMRGERQFKPGKLKARDRAQKKQNG